MSQSSSAPKVINSFSESSKATPDNKANSTKTQQGIKRVAPGRFEGESKRTAFIDHSSEEQVPTLVQKPFDQTKFINATEMIPNVRTNIQPMPEIPDEEFLEMAIEFEKKHPQ
ncbi:unnamed protein product [Rotaria magnacalcarata]|uniref:Uncharacterized protein n=1 Tax=Rotaria magnacalcarata TaxID=392030 RepID=A0A816QYQ0_9BILA|nr:unnamed protein product [Rotaria magnacalcarata]CAF4145241.1 unnamed protein product [Rotaria magnacalcarata]